MSKRPFVRNPGPKALLIIAIAAAFLVRCSEDGKFNPVGPPQRQMFIDRFYVTPPSVPAGGVEATITGRLVDQYGEPFAGYPMTFSAKTGTITAADTSGEDGAFDAIYRSGNQSGMDTITIRVGMLSAVKAIEILAPSPDITLRTGSQSILANGLDTTLVVAEIAGFSGQFSHIPIMFETTAGSFSGQNIAFAYTDANGKARVVLTSASSSTRITAVVSARVIDQVAGFETSGDKLPGKLLTPKSLSPVPKTQSGDETIARTAVTFRGVTIFVEATPTLIEGNGSATSTVLAFVKEDNLQAIASARVNFSARYGSIPVSAQTSDAGVARVTLTSAPRPGETDVIIARYGPELSDSVAIRYANRVERISLSSDAIFLRGDGVSKLRINALVLGGTGAPAAGIGIRFSTSDGTLLSSYGITNNDGLTSVQLVAPSTSVDRRVTIHAEVDIATLSPQPSPLNGTLDKLQSDASQKVNTIPKPPRKIQPGERVSANSLNATLTVPGSLLSVEDSHLTVGSSSIGISSFDDEVVDSLILTIRGIQVRLTTDPPVLVAWRGATSAVTALVTETTTGNPVVGDTVRFAATLGQVPGIGRLDANGQARVNFSASGETGIGSIRAFFGAAHRDSTEIQLLPTIGTLTLTSEKNRILAGDIDFTRLTASVVDPLGVASPNVEVWFQYNGDSTRVIADSSGQAYLVLRSPSVERDTSITVRARAGNASNSINIGISAIRRIISTNIDSLSAGNRTPVNITYQAFELSSGRPVTSETVWFRAVNGVVQPFAVLDRNGTALTTFTVGSEPGTAWVIGQLGQLPPDSVRLELVNPLATIALESNRRSLLANGIDTTTITVRAANMLGHPSPDITINLSTERGSIIPSVIRTSADGSARVIYRGAANTTDDIDFIRAIAIQYANLGFRIVDDNSVSSSLNTTTIPTGSSSRLREVIPVESMPADASRVAISIPSSGKISSPPTDEVDEISDSLAVDLRGVRMTLGVSPRSIRADGRSRTGVTVQLTETTSGAAISGGRIRLGASLGSIPAEGVTRPDGLYIDSLAAGYITGTSIIRATYGNELSSIDSVSFLPDPARVGIVFTSDRNEAPADGRAQVRLTARLLDTDGIPVPNVAVRFTQESPATVLADPVEYREVARWENSFRIETIEGVSGIRIGLQLRGVSSNNTRFYINRTLIDRAVPQGRQWSEYLLTLPAERLVEGVNRIELTGGIDLGVTDRFSIAGVRLGVVRSTLIDEVVTDRDGIATAVWTTDRFAEAAILRATLADMPARTYQRTVRLIPAEPAFMRIAALSDTLLASGEESTLFLALLADSSGNPVTDGYRISFTSDPDGTIEPREARTLGDGTASALFVAPPSDQDVNARLTATYNDISNNWLVALRGARLRVSTQNDRILADGTSQTTISARLSTNDGNSVIGRRIDFSSSHGSITSVAVTGNDGVARATLTSSDRPDTVMVLARFGTAIRDSLRIYFTPLIENINLSTNVASMRGDGVDSVVVSVSVVDGIGRGATGVRIDLNTSAGTLTSSRLTTDFAGRASTVLRGFATVQDDSIVIAAATIGGAFRDTVVVRLRGITLQSSVTPDSLAANGYATARVNVSVAETTTGNPVTSGRVSFLTNLGSITASANIDENGRTFATYTAATTPGEAEVTVRFGNQLNTSSRLTLVDRAADMQLVVNQPSILSNGVATSTIIVRITDPWGGAAPDESITLDFDGPGIVTPNLGITDRNGELRATVRGNPSNSDGRIVVTVTSRGERLRRSTVIELRGISLELTTNQTLISGDGRSTATISARVRETTSGHAVSNDTVRFTTTAGIIPAFARLGVNGEASVNLLSDPRPGIARVVALYGSPGLTDSVTVAFAGPYSYLNLRLAGASVLADNVDSTRLVATLRDTLGRPVQGMRVAFESLAGGAVTFDTVTTNVSGEAAVYARGDASTADGTVRIRSSIGSLADTLAFESRGVTVALDIEPDSLPANGRALATVIASVRETTGGNPVAGRAVTFTTNAGVIPATQILDNNGEATVLLRAPNTPAEATVTAAFGRTLSAQENVVFVRTIGSLELTPDKESLLGDALDSVVVEARALDAIGAPAPDLRINFSAPNGGRVFPASAVTNQQGIVRTTLYGLAVSVDSTISVEAVTSGGASAVLPVRLVGLRLTVSATPGELPANGQETAVVTASLTEVFRNTPVGNKRINFSATGGLIGRDAVTDESGRASVNFTVPGTPGDIEISAGYGSHTSTVTIACYPSVPATASLGVTPASISIAGLGRTETATLTIIIRDAAGNPVVDGSRIFIRETSGLGVTFPNSADTITLGTASGEVRTTVRSGATSGNVIFGIYASGNLLTSAGGLRIESGPPARIVVRPDVNTIHIPGGGLTALPVSAIVSDRSGNPVLDSTLVNFSLIPDTIAQITAVGYTNGGVVATPIEPVRYPVGIWVTFANNRAGTPIWVRARSGDVLDSVRIVLPGALQGGEPARMEVAIDSIALNADGTSATNILIRLFDADNRPVADMTEVRLTAQLGTVISPRFTANGEAVAIYRAGRVAGIDTVGITAGAVSEQVTLRLRPGATGRIEISSRRDTLRANGVDATTIDVRLFDRFDNPIGAGRQVAFSTSLGSINEFVQTDSTGRASVTLTSTNQTGWAVVSAASGEIVAQTVLRFVSGSADNIVLVGSDRMGIGVRTSGAPETATLIFEVRDDRGVPVDSLHSSWVRFRLDGPPRVINPDSSSVDSVAFLEPDSAFTDAFGRVAVTLRSGFFAGTVQITASTGADISGRAISVAVYGGPPDQSHFTVLPERCILTGILGTREDTTMIMVTVGDRFSNPVTPGTIVRFSSTGGVIEGAARTDSLGRAYVMFRTANPDPFEGLDTIYAQTMDWQDREITALTAVLVTGPTMVQYDTLSGWQIPFGGYRDFWIQISDYYDHSLTAGTTIEISVEGRDPRGELVTGLVLNGDAVGDPYVIAECMPRTLFPVRLFNYVSGLERTDISLTVDVTESRNGNLRSILFGTGLPQVVSPSRSRVVASPSEVIADGEARSTITIAVYDTLGIAIRNVPPDRAFIMVTGGGNALVTQPNESSDQNGRMTGSAVGRSVGVGQVEARIEGQLLDDQPEINFIPGPPSMMVILNGRRSLQVGGDTTIVFATVVDAFGNPVRDGTFVLFSSPDGAFEPLSGFTVNGVASSIFSSGTVAGPASFTVRASAGNASVEQSVTNLKFTPGPASSIAVTAPNYDVLVASRTTVTAVVTDQYNNRLSEGTRVALAVDPNGRGTIVPDTVMTDSTGRATANFTAGTVAGQTARIIATSGGASGISPSFTFRPGLPGRMVLVANPASDEVGSEITLIATITDAYGNDVYDTTRVDFSTQPQIGILNPRSMRTQNGVAMSVLSGVTLSGNVEARAQVGDLLSAAQVNFFAGPVTSLAAQAAPASVVIQRSSTITVTATDRFNNPVPNATIRFTITLNPGGACSLQHNSRLTGANGQASTVFTAGATTGSAIITVSCDTDGDGNPDVENAVFVDITAE